MNASMRRTAVCAACLFASTITLNQVVALQDTPAVQPEQDAPAVAAPDRWKGVIKLPGEQTLEFFVAFSAPNEDGSIGAKLDIPVQGVKEAVVTDVVYTDEQISFSLKQVGAIFSATIDPDQKKATGELKQAGMTFPMEMERISEADLAALAPNRPQHPEPPFPYTVREVKYENVEHDVQLAATLTIPEGSGPHPAVVMITGSGGQDRDETIFDHKPFLVIADHLTRNGIAVLRVDDRGVGESTGDMSQATTLDFVVDVRAGMAFLSEQAEIDPERIGLIGHSEGGLIAPIVAAESSDVAFIVLLAGTGVPGDEILVAQIEAISSASGLDEETVETIKATQAKILGAVAGGLDDAQIRAVLLESAEANLPSDLPEEEMPDLETIIEAQFQQVTSPWFRTFLTLDPRDYLIKTRCPVLAMNGELDIQVLPAQNLPAIAQALEAGGNEDVTIREFAGLNHLFQPAQTGLIAEYGQIETTFSPEALEFMAQWIRGRAGLEK